MAENHPSYPLDDSATLGRTGSGTGSRTPIPWSRATCPTIRRSRKPRPILANAPKGCQFRGTRRFLIVAVDLTADLPARVLGAVHVDVGDAPVDGAQQLRKLTRRETLPRRTDDLVSGDRSTHGSRPGSRAGRRPFGPVPQIRAEENGDAAVHSPLPQMDMRLLDVPLEIFIRERVAQRGPVLGDRRAEGSASGRGNGRRYFDPLQRSPEHSSAVIPIAGQRGRAGRQGDQSSHEPSDSRTV